MRALPVVVIGAGPQGLAAAAQLLEHGETPLVFEAGPGPTAAVSDWGHVRLFSDWSELVDDAAARLLAPTGWARPATGYPTGAQWISSYLAPLAAALGDSVRCGTRVTGVSRAGRDRLAGSGHSKQPFSVHIADADGIESRVAARAVIDASGTWSQPNPAGADGLPALGETAASDRITYRIPDFASPERFAGAHTVVVGSGHSAATAVTALAGIARRHPGTRVTWVLRRGTVPDVSGGTADVLPARGVLGLRAQEAVDSGLVDSVTGFRVASVTRLKGGVVLASEDGRELPAADAVVVLTGFRPDLSFLSEIRLDLDPTLQAPSRMAAVVDPNLHSCGTVRVTGATELAHPEADFYLVGAKSYGRAPTFLAATGYEQVRSVVAALAGG